MMFFLAISLIYRANILPGISSIIYQKLSFKMSRLLKVDPKSQMNIFREFWLADTFPFIVTFAILAPPEVNEDVLSIRKSFLFSGSLELVLFCFGKMAYIGLGTSKNHLSNSALKKFQRLEAKISSNEIFGKLHGTDHQNLLAPLPEGWSDVQIMSVVPNLGTLFFQILKNETLQYVNNQDIPSVLNPAIQASERKNLLRDIAEWYIKLLIRLAVSFIWNKQQSSSEKCHHMIFTIVHDLCWMGRNISTFYITNKTLVTFLSDLIKKYSQQSTHHLNESIKTQQFGVIASLNNEATKGGDFCFNPSCPGPPKDLKTKKSKRAERVVYYVEDIIPIIYRCCSKCQLVSYCSAECQGYFCLFLCSLSSEFHFCSFYRSRLDIS